WSDTRAAGDPAGRPGPPFVTRPSPALDLGRVGRGRMFQKAGVGSSVPRSLQQEGILSMAEYTLPDLVYDYGALALSISGQIMELHHSKHHSTYVKGANTALEKLAAARESGDFANVNQLSKDLAFNLGGH